MQRRRRLGWLGPTIAITGAAVAALATWYMVTARPEPGAVIDTIPIEAGAAFVVRAEAGGDRNFIELRAGDRVVWRALVPPYAGRPGAPGIAWNRTAVSIRVQRGGKAEVFALAMRDAAKLGGFKLAPGKGPARVATRGPVTLTDHVRSYEVVGGDGWHELVAVDLSTGEGLWKRELGPAPIEDGGVARPVRDAGEPPGAAAPPEARAEAEAGVVWVVQGRRRRAFRAADGTELGTELGAKPL